MDKWICIAVCFLISVLIYYLLKSYGINNIIEGQTCPPDQGGLCEKGYTTGWQLNMCNSIADVTNCGAHDQISCTEKMCLDAGLIPFIDAITPTEKNMTVCCKEKPELKSCSSDPQPIHAFYSDDPGSGYDAVTTVTDAAWQDSCCTAYNDDAQAILDSMCANIASKGLSSVQLDAIKGPLSTNISNISTQLEAQLPIRAEQTCAPTFSASACPALT